MRLNIGLSAATLAIGLGFSAAYLASAERSVFKQQQQSSYTHPEGIYGQLLEKLMPFGEDKADSLPRDTKWLVTVRILPPFGHKEVFLSLRRLYTGDAKGMMVVPLGQSIYEQCRALRERHPDVTFDELLRQILVQRKEFSEAELPQISALAHSFENLTLSPVLPDELSNDSTRYEIWSQSQYDQHEAIILVGPGEGSKKQPNPLLQWVEDYRNLLETFEKETKSSR